MRYRLGDEEGLKKLSSPPSTTMRDAFASDADSSLTAHSAVPQIPLDAIVAVYQRHQGQPLTLK
ncbi:MAG: hypothetical protein WKF30_18900, partial [Pyrinomonadaceae bacterium]